MAMSDAIGEPVRLEPLKESRPSWLKLVKAVQAILASVSEKPAQSVLSTVIGLAVLLIGATSVFGELQDALDRIWRAPVRNRAGGLWGLVRARLLSFGMVLGIAGSTC